MLRCSRASNRKLLIVVCFLTLLGTFCSARVFAVEVSWVGGVSGDWNTSSNWNIGVLPGPQDDVVVNTGSAVTILHSINSTTINSLTINGQLSLTGGSITITNPSSITGDISVINGASIIANGSTASLSVTNSANIDGGNLLAINGGHITLPGATRYRGHGILRADGNGSRLELVNLGTLGIGLPGSIDLTEAVSREFSLFNYKGNTCADPRFCIKDVVSREYAIFHRLNIELTGPELGITDVISREFSVFHRQQDNQSDAISREYSVFHQQQNDTILNDSVSREYSVFHQQQNDTILNDGVSREFTVEHLLAP